MKNDINSKTILSVFEFIQKYGEQTNDGKHYQGLTAFSDFDGYTVYLTGSGVMMRYGFHNTYHLDYEHDKQKHDFLSKVEQIHKLATQ
ncbi:DUF3081 family protein [Pseudoalteromonas aurantia]|uniref:DUF3081 domain-containing protein n=1 Tax=Pseudoalteromonas aurantia TaxID=43654 RepID=A0A5S3V586_9GAMM|nr:DUF3081 family protein [Pseudoalteromonas aurantia]TMO58347.1 DUF3081 domain-containing protein [Pseudoalteromonas aurantia]TMO66349.1 DUF3081 domain-containing protein [Pseudoalteromonas aurantia]TMO72582.1 DUF3081 domain-containing protein [Pseudoalteromonas aurantia]